SNEPVVEELDDTEPSAKNDNSELLNILDEILDDGTADPFSNMIPSESGVSEASAIENALASDYDGDPIMDILDDILEDVGGDEQDSKERSFTGESDSTRRAKRKKYWKTQEVRELIRANDPRSSAKAEEMIATLEMMAKEESNDDFLPGPLQYTMLIDAYAKSGTVDAIQRAEAVIDRIFEADEESNGTVISPTAQMLNAVMGAYANIGSVEAAERATGILERMEYMKEFGGSVKPTVHSYSLAISAWAKCESEAAAENAEKILNRLFEVYDEVFHSDSEDQGRYREELKPNNIVFNSVIDAWARSGGPDAGEKAEALLHRMEVVSRMNEYDVRPDTISFNTCIKGA
ncbi:hypothetical protein ACHAXR_000970, partial [Thalassiosira sp. AJA248-18]